MPRKPRTLDERDSALESGVEEKELSDLDSEHPKNIPEIYDHIFSVDESDTVKRCLIEIAAGRGTIVTRLVEEGWQAILNEAHAYEARRNRSDIRKKIRVSRAKQRFVQSAGPSSVGDGFVEALRETEFKRGRPK